MTTSPPSSPTPDVAGCPDFLEFTCRWAWGAVGPTDLKEKMTRGMHCSNRSATRRLEYQFDKVTYYPMPPGRPSLTNPLHSTYLLGMFTKSLEDRPTTIGDCRDFAGALSLAMLANGTDAQCLWMENTPANNDPANNFTTTLLCNANMDSNDPSLYSQRSFNFHVVCKAGGTTQDAAVSYFYLPSGTVHKNPAWGWNEDDHWQKQVGGTSFGLCASTETPWKPRPAFLPEALNPYTLP